MNKNIQQTCPSALLMTKIFAIQLIQFKQLNGSSLSVYSVPNVQLKMISKKIMSLSEKATQNIVLSVTWIARVGGHALANTWNNATVIFCSSCLSIGKIFALQKRMIGSLLNLFQ